MLTSEVYTDQVNMQKDDLQNTNNQKIKTYYSHDYIKLECNKKILNDIMYQKLKCIVD